MRQDEQKAAKGMSYRHFAGMIIVSTVVMFGLMYLNTYVADHIEFSQTRAWMAVVMGSSMAMLMMTFMWRMYPNTRINASILICAAFSFAIALWLVRSQDTVDDLSYVKAMIPHHSIAIMTSERAKIRDPEVRRLADGIIDAQVREIMQMKGMIARLEAHPPRAGQPLLRSYRDQQVAPLEPRPDVSNGIGTPGQTK